MKKIISVLISVIAAFSVCATFAVPAMAEIHVYSPQGVAITHTINDPLVNGQPSTQISGSQVSAGSDQLVFTYSGSGDLSGWNLVDNDGNTIEFSEIASACTIVSQEGNTIVIQVSDWAAFESPNGYTVNAVVSETTTSGVTTPGTTTGSTTVNKDNSATSPHTGVSVTAAAVCAACAGAAILAISKKKNAE